MKKATSARIVEIINEYDTTVRVMEQKAHYSVREAGRESAGGFLRAVKGRIQEWITEQIITTAWCGELGKDRSLLDINSKKISIPILPEYVSSIQDMEVRKFIQANIGAYKYGLSVDKHVFVGKRLVLGVECKAYAENAMLKRILVDFMLLKTKYKDMSCFLFQLESQLGGDYSCACPSPKGSRPTHTLMSYFPTVNLEVVTLLKGERRVDRPIHKPEHFKALEEESLGIAVEKIVQGFVRQGLA